MRRAACLLAALLVVISHPPGWAGDQAPPSARKLPDGVYAVRREGLDEKDVWPLKGGEVLAVHRHRHVKTDGKQPPRLLVVRSAPDVGLDLAAAPKAVQEGGAVVGILLKLRPGAAAALERLTRDRLGGQLTVVLGGEVVTMHKIRGVIKGGAARIDLAHHRSQSVPPARRAAGDLCNPGGIALGRRELSDKLRKRPADDQFGDHDDFSKPIAGAVGRRSSR